MGGYNSSIFAYGQTGAGKTYTMQGPLSAALQADDAQVRRHTCMQHTCQAASNCTRICKSQGPLSICRWLPSLQAVCVCVRLCAAEGLGAQGIPVPVCRN